MVVTSNSTPSVKGQEAQPRGWVPAKPCPACGKSNNSGWCTKSLDGAVVCCRVQEEGCFASREDTNGVPFYLHAGDGTPSPGVPGYSPSSKGRAGAERLHRVYTRLLELLTLEPHHRANLRDRGLRNKEIDAAGYRTLPAKGRRSVVGRLAEEFDEKQLLTVPGFVKKGEGEQQYLTLTGKAGLLIPVTDDRGRVVALKIRVDEPADGPKYVYLSSTRYDGPGPGSPVHVPPFTPATWDEIRIAEGELKSNIATLRTKVLTLGIPGAAVWRPALALAQFVGVQRVRLAFDADSRTNPAVAAAQLACLRAVKEAGIEPLLEVWNPKWKGIDDLLAAGKEPRTLTGDDALKEAERIAEGAGCKPGDNRPVIVISTEEHAVNEEAIRALAADPTLYQRGGLLSRVVVDDSQAGKGIRRPLAPRIEALPQPLLRERLTATARWFQVKQSNTGPPLAPAHPPGWSVAAVHARARWPGVRHLEAVVEYPVMRPDGTILREPGYDPETGLILVPKGDSPSLPDRPTLDDAVAARDTLLDVVGDFPFQREAHKSSWLAALLTPLARFAFAGPSPLFLVDSNVRGAGKGLSLHCIARIVTGEPFTVATYTKDEDELRKRITALAISGDRLVLFDNLTDRFGNGTLDAALTGTNWKDRVLGVNKMAEVPLLMTWYATGNNVAVGGDTARRICHVRLESGHERPEERQDFKRRDLLAWVGKRRGRLLGAALTILSAYCVAGRPDQELPAWGSYEGWSGLVRSAVIWVGMPDPGETRMLLQARADVAAANMAVLLRCWEKMDEDRKGLTAADVVHRLFKDRDGFDRQPAFYGEMRAAVEDLAGRGDAQKLGYRLRSYQRRVFDGRYLDRVGKKANTVRWAVYPAAQFSERVENPPHANHPPSNRGDEGDRGDSSPRAKSPATKSQTDGEGDGGNRGDIYPREKIGPTESRVGRNGHGGKNPPYSPHPPSRGEKRSRRELAHSNGEVER